MLTPKGPHLAAVFPTAPLESSAASLHSSQTNLNTSVGEKPPLTRKILVNGGTYYYLEAVAS
jgi:hypothetical protein